jgi:hypothetical protein
VAQGRERGSTNAAGTPNALALAKERLVALDTELGQQLLAEAVTADYLPLARHYHGQVLHTYCGVASGVIALNALLGQSAHAQYTFFTPPVAAICNEARVLESGMTLAELGAALVSHGAQVTVHHAEHESIDRFRELARDNVTRAGDFLIVNYLREAIGQRSGGHFSPLAAFHEDTDRFLILDVADLKYSPVWVNTELLFASMATIDICSGRSRGFLAVR